jgi:hypothetical protein
MDSPTDNDAIPGADQPAPEERKISRRSVMQAGLKAGPVIMTLPTVPAWAAVSTSVDSSKIALCQENPNTVSCVERFGPPSGASDSTNVLDDDPFAPAGKGKGKGKGKDKKNQGQGAFLDSGNWLD